MKQDYEKLMREALRIEEEPSEELDQKLMEKFKERDFMKKGKWNKKRVVAAAAALCVVLLGGTATVNAATDGGVERAISKFFTSVIYSSDDKQNFIFYQDENGKNVVQSGKYEGGDIEDIPDDTLSQEEKEDAKDNYDAGIIFTPDNEDGQDSIHYETSSDKQHALFKLKIGNDTSVISTNFEDWMDEEDKIWELRRVFNEYDVNGNSQEYIEELQKIQKKSKENFVKRAIEQAIEDIKSGKTIYIDRYDVLASVVDKNTKNPDEIVDAAWVMIDKDKLQFKDGKAEIICDSVAGYEMKCKCTIKKHEEASAGKYYIDRIEPVE